MLNRRQILYRLFQVSLLFIIMLNIPIIPRAYIDLSTSPVICRLCFEPSQQMLICNGACRWTFCTTCASQRRMRLCPIRVCSEGSLLIPLTDQKVTFYCVYRQCKEKFTSIEQFWHHCEICKFITEEARKQIQYKKKYQCKKGHKLYFVTSDNFCQIYENGSHYDTTNSETCSYCLSSFLSKSICLQCGQGKTKGVYCINCRPIPCEKKNCPVGHILTENNNFGDSMICDFCGLKARIYGNRVYSDRDCNFDICNQCYNKVPEKHPLLPLQNEIPKKLRVNYSPKEEGEDPLLETADIND